MFGTRGSLAVAVTGAALMIGTTSIVATAAPGGRSSTNQCASDHRNFLYADSATNHHGIVTIKGHSGYFYCDSDAEFIKLRKATITFKTTKAAPIRVLGKPYLNPNNTHLISHRRFPAYVSHPHGHEQYYRWIGPRDAITKLRTAFQS